MGAEIHLNGLTWGKMRRNFDGVHGKKVEKEAEQR